MSDKQIAATERLRKALEACHKAGLKGGVYDGSFYIWPITTEPDPRDAPHFGFFEAVKEVGALIHSDMNLDGGAGV